MKKYLLFLSIACLALLSACGPARPELAASCQPDHQQSSYFAGLVGGQCVAVSLEAPLTTGYAVYGRRDQPRPDAYETTIGYNWSSRNYRFNALEVSFLYPNPEADGETRPEEYWELVPGRQAWGHIDSPRPPDAPMVRAPVKGVIVRQWASNVPSSSTGTFRSNTGPQGPENYVEITKVEQHATSPDHLWITGRLSVDLYNFMGQPMQKIHNAEFRGSMLKPKLLAERSVWPPKVR